MLDRQTPSPLGAPALEAAAENGVRHGFFTRAGGVSDGIYAGLNVGLGSADDPERVRTNRSRIADWLSVPLARLATAHQVHSPDVVVVREQPGTERPRADALVTDRPGIALGILTADCGPVLFTDHEKGIVGAAHAGWKGALGGVLENTVAAMESLGARRERITAVLGPSISQRAYEVGPEFVARFDEADADNARYFIPSGRAGHALFDLNAYTIDRLVKAGVAAQCLDRCTYAEENNFFSYRRSVHRGEPDYGRQISAIVMEER
jgi:purine-nucleoside/S-methyl-5'-thioadenosine phosphorylase / adenosine deaminase